MNLCNSLIKTTKNSLPRQDSTGGSFMTKAELVDKLASEGGITKVQANKVLGALVEAVIAAMTSGEAVMLGGLGTFKVSKRNERKGRNPQTGKGIVVPASMVPKFTPARALKEAVAKMPLKEDA